MLVINIEIEGSKEVQEELKTRFLARLNTNLQEAIKISGHKIEADAINISPFYKGEYAEKMSAEFPEPLTTEVGPHAPHAPFVEFDTRPHFPPVQPLVEYAHLKLQKSGKEAEQVGFMIARKISKVGTKGQHILERAWDGNQETVTNIFLKAVEDSL